jgi:hypothetical protein
VLVHDHVFVQLTDIVPGQFVNVGTVELTDCRAVQRVNVTAADETYGVASAIVDVICHIDASNEKEISHGRVSWQTH